MPLQLAAKVRADFEEQYGDKPLIIASPGRINLIGEHTDYNQGLVLPAAINRYIVAALAKNGKDFCRITALDIDEMLELDLSDLQKRESGSWKNYVIGVVAELLGREAIIGNFDLVFCGNIPIGAGLSSSAALENSVSFGLNELFGLGLSKEEMVDISVRAEHNFAGVKCGMMDQFTNLFGKNEHTLFLNCAEMSHQLIPLEMGELEFLLINTNVSHRLSDSEYNTRRMDRMANRTPNDFPTLTTCFSAASLFICAL